MKRGTYPRTEEWKAEMSRKLTGIKRSAHTRALISASRTVDRDSDPEAWANVYRSKFFNLSMAESGD